MRLTLKPEERIQARVMAELFAAGVFAFHVPNESIGGVRYRSKRKLLGVVAGVPDIIIVTPPPIGGWFAAALELKRDKGGRVSDAQREKLDRFASLGWATAVAEGYDEAMSVLRGWGYGV